MGTIDQRGQGRRVVSDGQRQPQLQIQDRDQGQDEHPRTADAWGTPPAGTQHGIRLASGSAASRPPVPVRPIARDPDDAQGHPGDPGSPSAEKPAGAEQLPARRFRSDETHTRRPGEQHAGEGRTPGPLSRRIALRHRRPTSQS
jgi:hypothetical protein